MKKIKRLFFDIETSPNIGLFWTAGYKLNISPDSIIKERAIICICYKWAGDDKIISFVPSIPLTFCVQKVANVAEKK